MWLEEIKYLCLSARMPTELIACRLECPRCKMSNVEVNNVEMHSCNDKLVAIYTAIKELSGP